MSPNSDKTSFRVSVLPYLTKATHISAPFITTFLLIHLSAPALANVGGSTLSSQTMIVGRELYQSKFGRNFLGLTPIAIHAVSAIAKRLLSPKDRPARPVPNLLSTTGYATALFFLPIHYTTHRLNPTIQNVTILDHELVKTGLRVWPWTSWFLYTGLVVATSLHLAEGTTIIWNTWLKDIVFGAWKRSNRNFRLGLALTGIALPVLAGLYALSCEPLIALASTVDQYQASFMSSFIYRIQF